jgi:hypothetical protein
VQYPTATIHVFGLESERGAVPVPVIDVVPAFLALQESFMQHGQGDLDRGALVYIRHLLTGGAGPDVSEQKMLDNVARAILVMVSDQLQNDAELGSLMAVVAEAGQGFRTQMFFKGQEAAYDLYLTKVRQHWTENPGTLANVTVH